LLSLSILLWRTQVKLRQLNLAMAGAAMWDDAGQGGFFSAVMLCAMIRHVDMLDLRVSTVSLCLKGLIMDDVLS